MSYERVLPNPASLRYESPQVSLPRPSHLLDHKIMNDVPLSYGALPHRPAPGYSHDPRVRYADSRSTSVPQTHQQIASYARAKNALKTDSITSPVHPQSASLVKPASHVSNRDIPRRERSSSGSTSPVKSTKSEGAVQFCLCQPDPKIPRPRNAFILYRQHYQAAVVSHNPGLANPEISKIIGEQWRGLSEEEKGTWRELAEEEKIRHAQQYPAYRYQPRRTGRDGSSRNSTSGISHSISGGSICNRCGGKLMAAPASPMTPFTPTAGQQYRSTSLGGTSPHPNAATTVITARSSSCQEKEKGPPKPIRIDHLDSHHRHRKLEDNGEVSPDVKRRRLSHIGIKPGLQHTHRDRSPESPYPRSPYNGPLSVERHRKIPGITCARYGSSSSETHPDPSLKLPPLKTATPVTPVTPYSQEGSSVEATVMTIPFLNKIKVLARISPPLNPSFRDPGPHSRGSVIAIDGQDPELIRVAVEYLERALKKENNFNVRVFEGPEVQTPRQDSSDAGQMGDATVDYLNTISAWHRISDDIIGFVKHTSSHMEASDSSASPDHEVSPKTSPSTIVPKTANLQINSPAQSSENGSEVSTLSASTPGGNSSAMPVAIVPRYQLSTADAFACSIPIGDEYAPLDHWQWMASLWRACVGPDITLYIRECSKEELDRIGGNPVEVRLQDARTVILRRTPGSQGLEEKALRRVGFEIEDFLTQ
ncbi:hypothetical protein N7462_011695 [Penicillium macrosclerotiorum]|uniref:uncharacterized protein n=1 Tax=Penicillium macrosclerotiorum TaxID=303699 RepID=UPI0025485337|nr:uncharacterized protein N7462_011695 [Penicillium macrosclerotiorum]KAJ5662769.1 hypothetical protein N7462_011695 [Penicillium macrosclerotiorum]